MTHPVHLTPAQAKYLGLTGPAATRRPSRTRVPAAQCLELVCTTCGTSMSSDRAVSRHTEEMGHHRYECVLAPETAS